MAVLTTGNTFANGDQVTASSLNNAVNDAVFASGAVDSISTQLAGSGAIIVKDLGIDTGKIATGAVTTVKLASNSVSTAKIIDSNVTKAKIENFTNLTVLGNVSGSSAAPAEVTILDEDNMVSDSATSLATQQSIKAYADSKVDGTGSGAFTTLTASDDANFDSGTLFVDASTNCVGLGTTSDINTQIGGNAKLGAYDASGARIGIWGNGARWWYLHGEDSNALQIGYRASGNTVDGDAITILTGPQVGIGTTSPSVPLQVDANGEDGIVLRNNSSNNVTPLIEVRGQRSDGNNSQACGGGLGLTRWAPNDQILDGNTVGSIYFGGAHGATTGDEANILYTASIKAVADETWSSSTDMATDLVFRTGSTGRAYAYNQDYGDSEVMRITHEGNVGIRTAAPSDTLHVVGTGRITSAVITPLLKSGDGAANITIQGGNSGGANIELYGESHASFANKSFYDAETHSFRTANGLSTKLFIDSSAGNVGIGTSLPSAPLEVTSTTGGVILPRMTTTQMNAISSPTNGEMIYNTSVNKFYGYANGSWVALH